MTGRRTVTLLPVAVIGLFALLDSRTPPAGPPPEAAPELADVPIVAIRGQALAEHEEPLPPGARVRFGSTRFRHPRALVGWQITQAGAFLVTVHNGTFTLTDTRNGRRVLTQPVELPGWYHGVASSPDGSRLAVWTSLPEWGPACRLWRVTPNSDRPLELVGALTVPRVLGDGGIHVQQVAFSRDGAELLLVTGKGVARYDPATGHILGAAATELHILSISADGRRFLASEDGDPRFLIRSGSFMGFGPPKHRFRSPTPKAGPGSADGGPVGLWEESDESANTGTLVLTVGECRSGNLVARLTVPRVLREPVSDLDLSPNGRYLSHGFRDSVLVWDVEKHCQVIDVRPAGPRGMRRRYVDQSWFTPDGRHFVTCEADHLQRWFDLSTGKEVFGRAEPPPRTSLFGRELRTDLVSKDGNVIPAAGGPLPSGYSGARMCCSPNGRFIAMKDASGRLDVWSPDGRLVRTLRAGGKEITALAFSPDAKTLAACDRDRVLQVWAAGTWREYDRIDVPADTDELFPTGLAFYPNTGRLLVSDGDILAVWDCAGRTWAWDRPGYGGRSCRVDPWFSPDGSWVVCGETSQWIDAATGEDATEPAEQSGLRQALFRAARKLRAQHGKAQIVAPDGRLIAFVDNKDVIQVWDVATDRQKSVFPESTTYAHRDGILRFSPDGRRLVTCDTAHARVWEVATGHLAFTLDYPNGDIADVHFGPHGRSLITSNHREVIVWDLAPDPHSTEDAWDALAHEAPKAEQARRALLARPAQAVEMLRDRLRPVAPLDAEAVARLIRGLDAQHYRDREGAAAGLRAIGRRVLPMLREARLDSEEGAARLAALVRELAAGPTGDERRHIRAVEVLEQIDTPAARESIDRLAGGDPGAVLTAEAGAAKTRRAN